MTSSTEWGHMLDILFLGTGASIPSRDRCMPCVAVRCETETILFDCGEGTQRQLMISPFSFMKLNGIFITHMHGDHVLGLPGLIQTMGLSGRKEKLTVCGPEGFSESLKKIMSACGEDIEYELEIRDLCGGETVQFKNFEISAFSTDHNVTSIGYSLREKDSRGRFDRKKAISLGLRPGPDFSKLQNGENVGDVTPDMVIGPSRPGCKVIYSGDTAPCSEVVNAAKDADVLIHESTFSNDELKLAIAHKHSTSVQAAEIAKEANCRALFLIHISNRYDDKAKLENEAKSVFSESIIPNDLDLYKVSKREIRSA